MVNDLQVLGHNLISVLVLTNYTNNFTLRGSTLFYSPKLFLFGISNIQSGSLIFRIP